MKIGKKLREVQAVPISFYPLPPPKNALILTNFSVQKFN